jgi:hypothetical protein
MIKIYVHHTNDNDYTIMVIDDDMTLHSVSHIHHEYLEIELEKLYDEFSDTDRPVKIYR